MYRHKIGREREGEGLEIYAGDLCALPSSVVTVVTGACIRSVTRIRSNMCSDPYTKYFPLANRSTYTPTHPLDE